MEADQAQTTSLKDTLAPPTSPVQGTLNNQKGLLNDALDAVSVLEAKLVYVLHPASESKPDSPNPSHPISLVATLEDHNGLVNLVIARLRDITERIGL